MTRALRRAGLPIWYTEGFNKHPYLSFVAPLSLGFESEYECMDVRLTEDIPMEEVSVRMNAVMPEGLFVAEAKPAVQKPGKLAAAAYRLTLCCPPETLAAFLAQPSITAEKTTKKKEVKTVELRPLLEEVTVELTENGTVVSLTLPCSGSNTVNPMLIVQALSAFAGQEIPCRVRRMTLLDEEGHLFE